MQETRTNSVSIVRGNVEGKNLGKVIETMTSENGYTLDKILGNGEGSYWVKFSKRI